MAKKLKDTNRDDPVDALGPNYRIIGTSRLNLDLMNYRIGQQRNPREALKSMIRRMPDEITRLGRDLVERGPDPSLTLIVMPELDVDGQYTVLEGNRRLSALKLLENPSRAADINPVVAESFKLLKPAFDVKPILYMLCYVVGSREDARPWIDLRHLGKQEGRGLMQWGPTEKSNRRKDSGGKVDTHDAVLTYMKSYGRLLDVQAEHLSGKATNLNRVFGTAPFRIASKMSVSQNGTVSVALEDEARAHLIIEQVFIDFLTGGKALKDVYWADDRERYMADVLLRISPPTQTSQPNADNNDNSNMKDGGNQESPNAVPKQKALKPQNSADSAHADDPLPEVPSEHDNPASGQPEPNPDSRPSEQLPSDPSSATNDDFVDTESGQPLTASRPLKRRPKPDSLQRETVAPRETRRTLVIPDPWVNRVYIEMRDMSAEGNRAAGSVMMRVFLEMLTEFFLEQVNIPLPHGKFHWSDRGIKLHRKIELALYELDKDKTDPDLIKAWQGLLEDNLFHSVANLHKFVHNAKAHAEPRELKDIWDRWEPFMRKMCERFSRR